MRLFANYLRIIKKSLFALICIMTVYIIIWAYLLDYLRFICWIISWIISWIIRCSFEIVCQDIWDYLQIICELFEIICWIFYIILDYLQVI